LIPKEFPIWFLIFFGLEFLQSQLQRSSRNNSRSSGKEVESYDGFEQRAFSGTLRSENGDSRHADVFVESDVSEFVH
jgi:hypothetical protein